MVQTLLPVVPQAVQVVQVAVDRLILLGIVAQVPAPPVSLLLVELAVLRRCLHRFLVVVQQTLLETPQQSLEGVDQEQVVAQHHPVLAQAAQERPVLLSLRSSTNERRNQSKQ
jgi:hypothetical protein